jgi:hypothetical protein
VQLRVESLSETEERKKCIIDGSEVAKQVNKPISAGTNLPQEFLVRDVTKELGCATDV